MLDFLEERTSSKAVQKAAHQNIKMTFRVSADDAAQMANNPKHKGFVCTGDRIFNFFRMSE